MAFDPTNYFKGSAASGGIGGLLSGLFGGSANPYKDAMKMYQQYADQAAGYQNPFFEAGTGAIGDYQDYLSGMQDPSGFINQLMGDYQQSDYNKYLQDQTARAGLNAASAGGLVGSTPYMQAAQESAANIAQGGMNDWLANVLGINTQYGSGLQNMMGMGQGAANQLSNIYGGLGQNMGQGAYNVGMANQQQLGDLYGGLGSLAMLAFL